MVTTPAGIAFLQFSSLPRTLRVVVSDGRAGGAPVPGSLKARVRGVTDGDVVHVNPITTLADVWARKGEGLSHRRPRNVVERTLGIRRVLDNLDLSVTDRWFNGDRFLRWTLERGSVGAAAGALVRIIERRGSTAACFARVTRKGSPTPAPPPSIRRAPTRSTGDVIDGLLDAANGAASLTGGQAFGVGAAVAVIKTLVRQGLHALDDWGVARVGWVETAWWPRSSPASASRYRDSRIASTRSSCSCKSEPPGTGSRRSRRRRTFLLAIFWIGPTGRTTRA